MANWFYAIEEEQLGPVAPAEIERLIASGEITANTLIWKTGMNDWELASWHFEFEEDGTPPPVRTTPASPDPDIGPDGMYVGAPSREFVEAAKVCLSKYATFSGRASRSEFWFFYLFYNLVMYAAFFLDAAIVLGLMATGIPFFVPIFSLIVVFGTIIPMLAVSWRRVHDLDRTGWWLGGGFVASFLFYALMFGVAITEVTSGNTGGEPPAALIVISGLFVLAAIPYAITIFIFYVTKGTLGRNRFG